MTDEGYVGDLNYRHRSDGPGFTGVTPAEKDWSAGRMYVDNATGRLLSRTQAALLNADQVADEQGTGYWTARHRPAPQARRPARPTGPTATRAAKGLPMKDCTHARRGIVTSHPNGLPGHDGGPHAARSCCDRPECIDAGVRWVASMTNMPGHFVSDRTRRGVSA
jgi:hypothetical protein